jgi:hypothetical protein
MRHPTLLTLPDIFSHDLRNRVTNIAGATSCFIHLPRLWWVG